METKRAITLFFVVISLAFAGVVLGSAGLFEKTYDFFDSGITGYISHGYTLQEDVTLSNVSRNQITNVSFRITWNTNINGNSTLKYGTTPSLGSSESSASLTTDHSLTATGLQNNTLYFYNVSSYANSTNFAEVGPYNLTTLQDAGFPSLVVSSPLNGSAFNKTNIDLNYTVGDNNGVDKCWMWNISSIRQELPGCTNISFTAPEGSHVIDVYVNDTHNNLNHTRIRFAVDFSWPSISVQSPVHGGEYNSDVDLNFTLDEVAPDICWYTNTAENNITITGCANTTIPVVEGNNTIKVHIRDKIGRENSSDEINFTADTIAPVISNITLNTTPGNATARWITDVEADARVEYGQNSSRLGSTKTRVTFKTEHEIQLKNLEYSTVYYYNITSCDDFGNCDEEGPNSFTSPAEPDTPRVIHRVSPIDIPSINAIPLTESPFVTYMTPGTRFIFSIDNQQHELRLVSIYKTEKAKFTLKSEIEEFTINTKASQKFDLDKDGRDELIITLIEIVGNRVKVTAKLIAEEATPIVEEPAEVPEEELPEIIPPEEEKPEAPKPEPFYTKPFVWISAIVALFLVIGAGSAVVFKEQLPVMKTQIPKIMQTQIKPEELEKEVASIRQEIAEKVPKRLDTPLQITMDHVYSMMKRNYKDATIANALQKLNLEPIVIKFIMFEMRKPDNKIDMLLGYVSTKMEAGMTIKETKDNLLKAGWWKEVVEKAVPSEGKQQPILKKST